MPKIVAQIPDDIYRNIDEEIKPAYLPIRLRRLSRLLRKLMPKRADRFLDG
ncbi:MAG: hypothetical protein HQK89_03610 [Nitrospirae bacterium]|nr:hypothetical protein [Nitrospirota bacterium]